MGILKNMLIGKRLVIALGVLLTVLAAPVAIVLMNQYMDAAADSETVDYETLKVMIEERRSTEAVKLSANDMLSASTDPKDGVAYRLESMSIDATTGEATTTLEGIARFYPPAMDSHDDKVILGNNDMVIYRGTTYDIALDAAENGFAFYVVVLNENAPTSYEFEFELPQGFTLREDGSGGIEILNVEGAVVGEVAPPWAADINGESVPTEYSLRDDMLVQTVEHIGAEYPVVADPTYTLGWNIYVWFNVPSEIDNVGTWYTVGTGIAGIAVCTTFTSLSGGSGGVPCGAFYVYWGTAGAITLNDVIDELPSDPPDDCQLVGAFTYVGLLNYAEHSACGTDVKEYALETNTAQEIFDAIWPDDD